MNPRQLRLIVGFLAVFVLISVAPTPSDLRSASSGLLANVELPDLGLSGTELGDGVGNLLLLAAGGLVLSVGVIAARRRYLARPRRAKSPRSSTSRVLANRGSAGAMERAPESPLALRLRKESSRGVRAPELARQFGLSQDAVRIAVGRPATAPAARAGSSFRTRKPVSPAPAQATAVTRRRSPYQVMA